ncbi:MAG: hypothetical protein NTU96_08855 [Actinobacteria bacterium]|nr:hypothetical protein [Actinomycetota bacterium]
MRVKQLLSSRRLLFGGIAAALGFSSVAAPVVLQPAGATPAEGSNTTSDFSTQTIGTYESCTAYFGLLKQNSNLANFDIVNNTVDPEPVIANSQLAGPTLVPVVTLTDGSNNIIECTPTLGWTDQATWESDYMGLAPALLGNIVSYPGTGFWLLPAVGYELDYFDTALEQNQQFTAVTGTLRFESNLAGVSVLSSMVDLPTTAPTFDASNVAYQSSYWASVLDLVATAPTGSAEQAALLDAIANGFVNGLTMCEGSGDLLVPDANYASLIATLEALLLADEIANCLDVVFAGTFLVDAAIQTAKVANAPVTVTISDDAPPTTEPVVPAFTG